MGQGKSKPHIHPQPRQPILPSTHLHIPIFTPKESTRRDLVDHLLPYYDDYFGTKIVMSPAACEIDSVHHAIDSVKLNHGYKLSKAVQSAHDANFYTTRYADRRVDSQPQFPHPAHSRVHKYGVKDGKSQEKAIRMPVSIEHKLPTATGQQNFASTAPSRPPSSSRSSSVYFVHLPQNALLRATYGNSEQTLNLSPAAQSSTQYHFHRFNPNNYNSDPWLSDHSVPKPPQDYKKLLEINHTIASPFQLLVSPLHPFLHSQQLLTITTTHSNQHSGITFVPSFQPTAYFLPIFPSPCFPAPTFSSPSYTLLLQHIRNTIGSIYMQYHAAIQFISQLPSFSPTWLRSSTIPPQIDQPLFYLANIFGASRSNYKHNASLRRFYAEGRLTTFTQPSTLTTQLLPFADYIPIIPFLIYVVDFAEECDRSWLTKLFEELLADIENGCILSLHEKPIHIFLFNTHLLDMQSHHRAVGNQVGGLDFKRDSTKRDSFTKLDKPTFLDLFTFQNTLLDRCTSRGLHNIQFYSVGTIDVVKSMVEKMFLPVFMQLFYDVASPFNIIQNDYDFASLLLEYKRAQWVTRCAPDISQLVADLQPRPQQSDLIAPRTAESHQQDVPKPQSMLTTQIENSDSPQQSNLPENPIPISQSMEESNNHQSPPTDSSSPTLCKSVPVTIITHPIKYPPITNPRNQLEFQIMQLERLLTPASPNETNVSNPSLSSANTAVDHGIAHKARNSAANNANAQNSALIPSSQLLSPTLTTVLSHVYSDLPPDPPLSSLTTSKIKSNPSPNQSPATYPPPPPITPSSLHYSTSQFPTLKHFNMLPQTFPFTYTPNVSYHHLLQLAPQTTIQFTPLQSSSSKHSNKANAKDSKNPDQFDDVGLMRDPTEPILQPLTFSQQYHYLSKLYCANIELLDRLQGELDAMNADNCKAQINTLQTITQPSTTSTNTDEVENAIQRSNNTNHLAEERASPSHEKNVPRVEKDSTKVNSAVKTDQHIEPSETPKKKDKEHRKFSFSHNPITSLFLPANSKASASTPIARPTNVTGTAPTAQTPTNAVHPSQSQTEMTSSSLTPTQPSIQKAQRKALQKRITALMGEIELLHLKIRPKPFPIDPVTLPRVSPLLPMFADIEEHHHNLCHFPKVQFTVSYFFDHIGPEDRNFIIKSITSGGRSIAELILLHELKLFQLRIQNDRDNSTTGDLRLYQKESQWLLKALSKYYDSRDRLNVIPRDLTYVSLKPQYQFLLNPLKKVFKSLMFGQIDIPTDKTLLMWPFLKHDAIGHYRYHIFDFFYRSNRFGDVFDLHSNGEDEIDNYGNPGELSPTRSAARQGNIGTTPPNLLSTDPVEQHVVVGDEVQPFDRFEGQVSTHSVESNAVLINANEHSEKRVVNSDNTRSPALKSIALAHSNSGNQLCGQSNNSTRGSRSKPPRNSKNTSKTDASIPNRSKTSSFFHHLSRPLSLTSFTSNRSAEHGAPPSPHQHPDGNAVINENEAETHPQNPLEQSPPLPRSKPQYNNYYEVFIKLQFPPHSLQLHCTQAQMDFTALRLNPFSFLYLPLIIGRGGVDNCNFNLPFGILEKERLKLEREGQFDKLAKLPKSDPRHNRNNNGDLVERYTPEAIQFNQLFNLVYSLCSLFPIMIPIHIIILTDTLQVYDPPVFSGHGSDDRVCTVVLPPLPPEQIASVRTSTTNLQLQKSAPKAHHSSHTQHARTNSTTVHFNDDNSSDNINPTESTASQLPSLPTHPLLAPSTSSEAITSNNNSTNSDHSSASINTQQTFNTTSQPFVTPLQTAKTDAFNITTGNNNLNSNLITPAQRNLTASTTQRQQFAVPNNTNQPTVLPILDHISTTSSYFPTQLSQFSEQLPISHNLTTPHPIVPLYKSPFPNFPTYLAPSQTPAHGKTGELPDRLQLIASQPFPPPPIQFFNQDDEWKVGSQALQSATSHTTNVSFSLDNPPQFNTAPLAQPQSPFQYMNQPFTAFGEKEMDELLKMISTLQSQSISEIRAKFHFHQVSLHHIHALLYEIEQDAVRTRFKLYFD